MESVQNDLFQTVINFLSESFFGKVLLTLVVLAIVSTPTIKLIIKEYKESKTKKEEKEKAEKEKEEKRRNEEVEKQKLEYARTEQFRSGVESSLKSITKLTEELGIIETELEEIRHMKEEITDELHRAMTEMNERMDNDKARSDTHDSILRNNLNNIAEHVESITDEIHRVSESTGVVENNIGILFEGENNEFRVYITQIHERYVGAGYPVPRDIKQELRIRYDMYKKRGGNGWAEEMFNEIMSSDLNQ